VYLDVFAVCTPIGNFRKSGGQTLKIKTLLPIVFAISLPGLIWAACPTTTYTQGFETADFAKDFYSFHIPNYPLVPNVTRYASGDPTSPLGPLQSATGSYYGVVSALAPCAESGWAIPMCSGAAFYFGSTGSMTDAWTVPTSFDPYVGPSTISWRMYIPVDGPNAWRPQANSNYAGLIINANFNTGSGNYMAETNMDFSVSTPGSVCIGLSNDYYYAPPGHCQLATIVATGWYTFAVTVSKAGNGTTSPGTETWWVFDSSNSSVGNYTTATGGPSSAIRGPGYFEIAAQQPGFGGNRFAIDDIRSFIGSPVPPPAAGTSATFLKTDAATQGNWVGVYGADGYNVSQDASIKPPAYAQINLSNYANFLWAASSGSSNSLQRPENPSSRIAGTWFSRSSFFIDVNLTDGNPHQVSLYALDYDSIVRAETINVRDAATNAILDSRTVAAGTSFHKGEYLVWNIQGHVKYEIIVTAGSNAVISGIFFK
jgi:hypothetical protein